MIERDFILFFGLSGLLSRSCNIMMDARFSGYEFYLSLDYSIFIAYNGDCLDRYVLRFNEMIESCRIIYAILYVMLRAKKGGGSSSSVSASTGNE
jgi:NADH:ubiquinone oxidoreductase subunit D